PSRRRHTRFPRDWSSDVCSSDLQAFSGVTCSPHSVIMFAGFSFVSCAIAALPINRPVTASHITFLFLNICWSFYFLLIQFVSLAFNRAIYSLGACLKYFWKFWPKTDCELYPTLVAT